MHFHVFPALHISHPSSPLTLFLGLMFEFAVVVVAIVLSILDLGPILMFVCPLALDVASWLVVAVVVVGGVVVVALALAVCLPLVVGVVFGRSVPIIVCTPLRLATLEVALRLVLCSCPIMLAFFLFFRTCSAMTCSLRVLQASTARPFDLEYSLF